MARKPKKTGLQKRDEMRKHLGSHIWDEFGYDPHARYRSQQPAAHILLLVVLMLVSSAVWALATAFVIRMLMSGGLMFDLLGVLAGLTAFILWLRAMFWSRDLRYENGRLIHSPGPVQDEGQSPGPHP